MATTPDPTAAPHPDPSEAPAPRTTSSAAADAAARTVESSPGPVSATPCASSPSAAAPTSGGDGASGVLRRLAAGMRRAMDRTETKRQDSRQAPTRLGPGSLPHDLHGVGIEDPHVSNTESSEVSGTEDSPAPPRVKRTTEAHRPVLDRLPSWLVRSGLGSWLILGVLIIIALIVYLTSRVVPVFVGLFLALVITAILHPLVDLFAHVMPRFPATFLALLTALAVVGGLVAYVVSSVTNQWDSLANQFQDGVQTIIDFVEHGPLPFHVTQRELADQVSQWLATGQEYIQTNAPTLASEVVSNAGAVVEGFTVLALAVFTAIFFLASGGRMWRWILDELPARHREAVHRAAGAGWYSFSGYARGTVLVALTDAIMAGIFLQIVGVPLAAPLAVLVFIGAFVPIIGAPTAMVIAMIVALASRGPVMMLVVCLGVAGIGQIEGHILQPLIMGRQVSLHPVVVIVGVAVGTFAAGLLGAIIAVPLIGVIWSVYSELHIKDSPVVGDLPAYGKPS